MRFILFIVFLLFSTSAFSEIRLNISYEKTSDGYILFAHNQEYCPVSVRLNMELKNLSSTSGNNKIFVIPANSSRFIVTRLRIKKRGEAYGFNYKTSYNYGNHYEDDYSEEYVYRLPFRKGTIFPVGQGYNGNRSHQNENALDFTVPAGTEIYSVREGVVIAVEQKNSRNCGSRECAKFNNYIKIYHPDGSFAEYTHIRQNGSVVNVGDKVKAGEFIGYSGNVGWSTGPHLHLVIYLQKIEEKVSLQTKFLTGTGAYTEYLVEGSSYKKEY